MSFPARTWPNATASSCDGVGQHRIERQLRSVRTIGQPLAGFGHACLVVDDDLSALANIHAVHAHTQAQRTNLHILQFLLAELHGKRRARQLKLQPRPQQISQPLTLHVQISRIPGRRHSTCSLFSRARRDALFQQSFSL